VSPGGALPDGWDLTRLRSIEPAARLLPADGRHVVVPNPIGSQTEYRELRAAVVIDVSGQCLVREAGEDAWWMDGLDPSDGTIVCWGSYGDDLDQAMQAL
jgi:hypothetical protein